MVQHRTAWAEGGTDGVEWSRRSSLKSTILHDMDGMVSRTESPGPGYTENPLEGLRDSGTNSPGERDRADQGIPTGN